MSSSTAQTLELEVFLGGESGEFINLGTLFISQNRGGGVDPIITFTFGGNSYYSEGESKLVYYDYNNNEHVLKTWNKAYIIDFTVNIPKNIITST